ncbi:hypothetical protein GA0070624_3693 [Micromonospora rhizosphaerae]|uniref:Uncharacterized protein n=1 Tax=Micromonospora rhizosphaerae TaxID=568872 RepID=A0A1C6SGK1_9ACTN|nr:hypothetical protein [Micromonospora rhizosphaerae]SCL28438.1 hypothetical protein GA0070624_3693 [Micromonospora rhizosphaerae]
MVQPNLVPLEPLPEDAGIDGLPPERSREVREREQHASAALVGASTVEFIADHLATGRAVLDAVRDASPAGSRLGVRHGAAFEVFRFDLC